MLFRCMMLWRRFWLASCVEAFLRGSDVRSQVLMARAGLLQHLVDGVLNSQGSGNLQVTLFWPICLARLVHDTALVFSQVGTERLILAVPS